jgi:putative ABC transport system ATP-binding protein
MTGLGCGNRPSLSPEASGRFNSLRRDGGSDCPEKSGETIDDSLPCDRVRHRDIVAVQPLSALPERNDPSVPADSRVAAGPQAGLRVRGLYKSYRLGDERLPVLEGMSLDLDAGEMVAIMGPSGSGKTTLLNCISGIDRPDEGTVEIAGDPVDYRSERARTAVRRERIGMVFQFFNLVPTLTVRENIALPFLIMRRNGADTAARVAMLLAEVGLEARAGHYPFQLSGGEMQLVSIARALVHRPALLLADEPTGNVNPAVGRSIMNTLRDTARREGAGVLLVTHSAEHAAWADRVCFLRDGVIAAERIHRGEAENVRPIHDQLAALGI